MSMETKMKIEAELDFYRSYSEKCLRPGRGKPRIYISPAERMKFQQDMMVRMLEERPSYEPVPWWYRDVGASERRAKELLPVSKSFDPIWVDYEDKTAFFDESEKLVPTPKKRVWYHQTPQILGRTYGFIFKPEAGQ